MLAATTLLDPGDEVILSSPYFVNQEMALRAIGVIPVEAWVSEAQQFPTRWPDIEPDVTSRTRAVVLCTLSNATGSALSPEEFLRISLESRFRPMLTPCA